jgi:hypothetical protein
LPGVNRCIAPDEHLDTGGAGGDGGAIASTHFGIPSGTDAGSAKYGSVSTADEELIGSPGGDLASVARGGFRNPTAQTESVLGPYGGVWIDEHLRS